MWTCPKCGREFSRIDQSHFCGDAPKTIDEYIAACPEEKRPRLEEMRKAVKAGAPEAKEAIAWGMPNFKDAKNIVQFASFKDRVTLYAGEKAVEAFADKLGDIKTRKDAIYFPDADPLPADLITEIVSWVCANR